MTLTVPRAGTIAGAAPTIRVEPSDTGAVLAEFGSRLTEKAEGWKAEQRKLQESQLKLNIARDLGRAKLEVQQTGDPVKMGADWDAASRDIEARYITEDTDPQVKANLRLFYQGLKDEHTFDLSGAQNGLLQSQRKAQWLEFRTSALSEGAAGDEKTAAAMLSLLNEGAADLEAAGLMTPEEAAKERLTIASDMADARAVRAIETDPTAALTALEKGEFRAVGAAREAALVAAAQGEVTKRATAAAAEAKRLETERVTAARETVSDAIKVTRTGSAFARIDQIEAINADPVLSAALQPELTELANADALRRALPEFAASSLDAKRKMRADMMAKPKDKAYEADVVSAMDKAIAEHEAALKNGGIYDYVASLGLSPVAPLPDPATASKEEMGAALAKRTVAAAGLAAAGMTGSDRLGQPRPAPIFTAEELPIYAARVAPEASPKDRASFASLLASTPNLDTERAAAELGADAVFTHVGGGMAAGDLTEKLATEVFEGQRAMAAKEVAMPPTEARRTPFFRDMPRLFDDGTGGFGDDDRAEMNATLAAADALYAYRIRGTDAASTGVIDETIYRQALHEVMGGKGAFGSRTATGGLGSVENANGSYYLPLPQGVAAGAVNEAFSAMTERLYLAEPVRAAGVTADTALGPDVWKRLSTTKNAPTLGGKPIDGATFRRLELRPLGGDAYELVLPGETPGSYEPVGAEGGKPFILSLSRFLDFTGADQ